MLLFLDVDGPLIPFRARDVPGSAATPVTGNPLLDRLDPRDGRRLLGLGCELVWATTWMADANEIVAPRLGLPELPIVDFPDDAPPPGLHWKTRPLIAWAAGRPFIWLDDELTGTDQCWVAEHHAGRALLHRVDPLIGLTGADFRVLREYCGQRT